MHETNKASDLTLLLSGKVYTEHYINKFTCYYVLLILCHKSYVLNSVIIVPFMAKSS